MIGIQILSKKDNSGPHAHDHSFVRKLFVVWVNLVLDT